MASEREYVEGKYGEPLTPPARCFRGCGIIEAYEAWAIVTGAESVTREALARAVIAGYPDGFLVTKSSTFAAAVASLLKHGDDLRGITLYGAEREYVLYRGGQWNEEYCLAEVLAGMGEYEQKFAKEETKYCVLRTF